MTPREIAVVTGGAGFLGSHMVDLLLDEDYEVRVIDNLTGGHESNLAHHQGDERLRCFWEDIRTLQAGSPVFTGARSVFHFAGIGDIVPSVECPLDYMETNVQGTARVLECARHARVHRVLYAASSSCYGLAATPTREDHPVDPQYPYALSKHLGELTAFHWYKVYGLPVNSLCIFNAYGTRVRTTGAYGAVFGVFLRQKLAGQPFTVVGDGTQSRDFVYASDVAAAFLMAAETKIVGERFNVGGGSPQSVNRLVQLLGGDVIFVPKRPGEPHRTHADIGKITALLGWHPSVPFEEGVTRMLADIRHWESAPLWSPESIAEATKTWFMYMNRSAAAQPNSQSS